MVRIIKFEVSKEGRVDRIYWGDRGDKDKEKVFYDEIIKLNDKDKEERCNDCKKKIFGYIVKWKWGNNDIDLKCIKCGIDDYINGAYDNKEKLIKKLKEDYCKELVVGEL